MTVSVWTESMINSAAKMWVRGLTVTEIGKSFGMPKNSVCSMTHRNRDRFPKRREYRPPKPKKKPIPVVRLSDHIPRVTRTTITGAKVTLPRVSFIDGYCRSNELAGEAR